MSKKFLNIKKIYIQSENQKKDLINNLIKNLNLSQFIEIEFIRIKVLIYFLNYENEYKYFINKKFLKSQNSLTNTMIDKRNDEIYKLFNNLLEYILRYKFYTGGTASLASKTLIAENPNFTKEFYSSFYYIEKTYFDLKNKKKNCYCPGVTTSYPLGGLPTSSQREEERCKSTVAEPPVPKGIINNSEKPKQTPKREVRFNETTLVSSDSKIEDNSIFLFFIGGYPVYNKVN